MSVETNLRLSSPLVGSSIPRTNLNDLRAPQEHSPLDMAALSPPPHRMNLAVLHSFNRG